jgi:hypothetical protein
MSCTTLQRDLSTTESAQTWVRDLDFALETQPKVSNPLRLVVRPCVQQISALPASFSEEVVGTGLRKYIFNNTNPNQLLRVRTSLDPAAVGTMSMIISIRYGAPANSFNADVLSSQGVPSLTHRLNRTGEWHISVDCYLNGFISFYNVDFEDGSAPSASGQAAPSQSATPSKSAVSLSSTLQLAVGLIVCGLTSLIILQF